MEVKIDLRDLLAELIRKAWFILIIIVLGALAAGAYKYRADVNLSKNKVTNTSPDMSDEDTLKVDSYVTLQREYDGKRNYVDNSLYMAMDPYHYYKADLQFYINAEDPADNMDLMYAYQYYITKGGLVSDIHEMDQTVDKFYLQEMIGMNELTSTDQIEREVMNVILFADSDDAINSLAENVQTSVMTYHDELNAIIGEHELVLLDESVKLKMDGAIESYQTDTINKVNDLKLSMEEAKGKLSATQLAYAEKLLSGEITKESKSNEEDLTESTIADDVSAVPETVPEKEPAKVHISKKYMAVGAAGGLLIGIILIILYYVFSSTLKGVRDIQKMFEKSYLGRISDRKKNILDRLANRLFIREPRVDADTEQKLLESKLLSLCKNTGLTSVALSGADSLMSSARIQSVISDLKERGIDACWIGDILKNPDAIGQLETYHHIVLVEKIKKSRYEDIYYKIRLCEEQGIDVLGYAVIS